MLIQPGTLFVFRFIPTVIFVWLFIKRLQANVPLCVRLLAWVCPRVQLIYTSSVTKRLNIVDNMDNDLYFMFKHTEKEHILSFQCLLFSNLFFLKSPPKQLF